MSYKLSVKCVILLHELQTLCQMRTSPKLGQGVRTKGTLPQQLIAFKKLPNFIFNRDEKFFYPRKKRQNKTIWKRSVSLQTLKQRDNFFWPNWQRRQSFWSSRFKGGGAGRGQVISKRQYFAQNLYKRINVDQYFELFPAGLSCQNILLKLKKI